MENLRLLNQGQLQAVSHSFSRLQEHRFGVIPLLRKGSLVYILLIQQRSGIWGFPKGSANPDEDGLQCALRELYEETGISKLRLIDNLVLTEHYYRNSIERAVHYFVGWVDNDTLKPNPEEVINYRWLSYHAAKGKATSLRMRDLITHLGRLLYLA
ncbi:MAG: NUDIX domain-containing protein [Candidatus Methanomethylicaceae archaeon]